MRDGFKTEHFCLFFDIFLNILEFFHLFVVVVVPFLKILNRKNGHFQF